MLQLIDEFIRPGYLRSLVRILYRNPSPSQGNIFYNCSIKQARLLFNYSDYLNTVFWVLQRRIDSTCLRERILIFSIGIPSILIVPEMTS